MKSCEALSPRTDDQIFDLYIISLFDANKQTNTKNLKSGSYYETNIKISYETSSSTNNYPQKPLELFYKERCS